MSATRYDGPIIDAHHHLWDLSGGHYPWLMDASAGVGALGDIGYLRRDYLVADFLADAAGQGITGSVHIEALWDRTRSPVEETRWLDGLRRPPGDACDVASRYVVAAPLDAPGVDAVLDQQAQHRRAVGVRETIRWHPDPAKRWTRAGLVDDPAWRSGLARLRQHGFLLELLMNAHQATEVAALAGAHPDQPIVVNHCCTPNDRDPAGMARWRAGLRAMGEMPNIHIKLSNYAAYSPERTLAGDRDTILTCIDAFGPARCMFGSDYPVAKRTLAYPALCERFREVVAEFSHDEQRALFHDNAALLYRMGAAS